MCRYINVLVFVNLLLFISSCVEKREQKLVELEQTGEYLSFVIPDDVKYSSVFVQKFTDRGNDYLAFKNEFEQEILFYELNSKSLKKRITYPKEGANSIVGGFLGFHILDLDNIYIPSLYINKIYLSDSVGNLKRVIDFAKTDSGQNLIPFIPGLFGTIDFIDNKMYIPQTINPMLKENVINESPIGAVVDTVSKVNLALPMKFPNLITKNDIGTPAGNGLNYYRCFDSKHFVYSFYYSDIVYVANISHDNVSTNEVKSMYAHDVRIPDRGLQEVNEMLKYNLEHSCYGRIYYDEYRKVYYRIAYPANEVNGNGNLSEIIRSGRKNFSIIVLDEDFKIIGETLFPDYFYNSNLLFVAEDGLYISTSNERNRNFDENYLTFERIELTYNKD